MKLQMFVSLTNYIMIHRNIYFSWEIVRNCTLNSMFRCSFIRFLHFPVTFYTIFFYKILNHLTELWLTTIQKLFIYYKTP